MTIKQVLQKTGFTHYKEEDFTARSIELRHGSEAVLWVHNLSGHGILDPSYWADDKYYQEEYRKEFSAFSKGHKVKSDEHFKIFKNLNKKQFKQFSKHLKSNTNYIEVGCSFGGVFDHVVNFGAKEFVAIEPNREDADYLKHKYPSAKVINSVFEDVNIENNHYDVFASFEVLEHAHSPRKFLEKANNILKKGSILHLEVPNHYDVLLSCYRNINYDGFYYHKAHIHYFTPESLKELCVECGFDGDVTSFLMYPFFNHVYWHHNKGPQTNAREALNLPVPTCGDTEVQKKINTFYKNTEERYEELINENMLGDCLVFQGVKK